MIFLNLDIKKKIWIFRIRNLKKKFYNLNKYRSRKLIIKDKLP